MSRAESFEHPAQPVQPQPVPQEVGIYVVDENRRAFLSTLKTATKIIVAGFLAGQAANISNISSADAPSPYARPTAVADTRVITARPLTLEAASSEANPSLSAESPQNPSKETVPERVLQRYESTLYSMRTHPDIRVRSVALLVPTEVKFTDVVNSPDGDKYAVVSRLGGSYDFDIYLSKDRFDQDHSKYDPQEAQRQIFKSHIVLSQAKTAPESFAHDPNYALSVIIKADVASREVFTAQIPR